MGTVDTAERLSKLRQLMQQHKVDVYSMASLQLFGFFELELALISHL
jgi:hypothetical protein